MTTSRDDVVRNRGAVYQLLALLWAQELTGYSLQLLEKGGIRESWTSLGGADPSSLAGRLDQLAEDYCRLFVGPTGHLPLIQSVWTDGELQSDVVSSLTEFAAVCGFESPWSGLLPDHLANELQIMGQILEGSALEADAAGIEASDSCAAAMFGNHLAWAMPLLNRITERDSGGFYGTLATVTQSFLESELSFYETAESESISNMKTHAIRSDAK